MFVDFSFFVIFLLSAGVCRVSAVSLYHGPYLQNVGECEATVVWVSDVPTVGWVELAPDDGTNFYATARERIYDTADGVKQVTGIHAVKLTGLQPGTTYRYRVYVQEVKGRSGVMVYYGDLAATEVYHRAPLKFTTNDRRKEEMSFVMLNDVHERPKMIAPLLEAASYKDRDLIIYNGDMVSELRHDSTLFQGFMDESIRLFAQEKPWYYVRGNHETRGVASALFHRYFCPCEPHLYYTFRQGPVMFVALDCGEDKPDTDIAYSGIVDYDNYRSRQAEWLRGVVQGSEWREAPVRVVICHVPPSDAPRAWHGEREIQQKFLPVLNGAGVSLMLCGHMHAYSFHAPDARHDFPILVNSSEDCVLVETEQGRLKATVITQDGKRKTVMP